MDKKDYIETLKSLNLRPKKVKVEGTQEILLEVEQPNNEMNELHNKIVKWFLENPYPDDDKVHAFAESLGMEPDKFESHIYMVLSSFLSEGRSKGEEIGPDPKELEMGIKVEMEHTTMPIISRKIVMDHLAEISDYYTRLYKMETEAGVDPEE